MKQSIGIIGAGWLGQPLAQTLIEQGCDVVVTGQSEQRLAEFAQLNLNHHQLSLPQRPELLAKLPALQQRVLIIAIPPQIKRGKADYPEKIANLVSAAEISGVKQIILLNSTAIANGLEGEVNEFTELNLTADKVAILAEAENELLKFTGDAQILRLSGLVGPKRHPGRFISPEREFSAPEQPVNLIHQADVIGLLLAMLNKGSLGSSGKLDSEHRIYHGVSQTHLSRREYYRAAAAALGRPTPKFSQEQSERTGKVITDDWTRAQLEYDYQYDDLSTWLTEVN
ncbi:NAD(P)H-binding protein [Endozoicomonas sp. G2_1]|uniref:NAD(P)H-binding protein n=1 Tax=Endozoicomonas sp. G2_1 TaxID=2821091 RepID=UPI001ADBAE69|nr:NAD(P)H-binding protein [Endozoicomonas sp. G2_1]